MQLSLSFLPPKTTSVCNSSKKVMELDILGHGGVPSVLGTIHSRGFFPIRIILRSLVNFLF